MKKNLWILKICLLIQGLALGLFALIYETPFGSFLFLNLDLPEKLAYGFDDFLGILLILVSVLSLFWKNLAFYLYMSACFFIFALFQTIMGGIPHSNLTIIAHALRFLAPIGLFLILKDSKSGLKILKLGLFLTFVGHGIECLLKDPLFIDYLIYALRRFSLSETAAKNLLLFIGLIDILVGILAFFVSRPWVFFYMAFWGFITALYRVFFEGEPGVLSMLIRCSHFLVPIFLGIYGLKSSRKKRITL